MAEITKLIQVGDYKFELTLKSKSVHAHSLMTDRLGPIDLYLASVREHILDDLLNRQVEYHKEEKKL